jgi:hypothetical protein
MQNGEEETLLEYWQRTNDWGDVKTLNQPIRTTGNDVVFSGHGAIVTVDDDPDIPLDTQVPEGMEFWTLGPMGSLLIITLANALEYGDEIVELGLRTPNSNRLISVKPKVFGAGETVPNLILKPKSLYDFDPEGPHVKSVGDLSHLHELWPQAEMHRQPGKTLRVFWGACMGVFEGGPDEVDANVVFGMYLS